MYGNIYIAPGLIRVIKFFIVLSYFYSYYHIVTFGLIRIIKFIIMLSKRTLNIWCFLSRLDSFRNQKMKIIAVTD